MKKGLIYIRSSRFHLSTNVSNIQIAMTTVSKVVSKSFSDDETAFEVSLKVRSIIIQHDVASRLYSDPQLSTLILICWGRMVLEVALLIPINSSSFSCKGCGCHSAFDFAIYRQSCRGLEVAVDGKLVSSWHVHILAYS